MRSDKKRGVLVLKDGSVFWGWSVGYEGENWGEVVFNTSMTGYQEILTDPSYARQIVTMTYTEIGNYGVNDEDIQSNKVQVAGFVVREASKIYSNWRAKKSLIDYLKEYKIPMLEGVDTRKLTRKIRIYGAIMGIIKGDLKDEKEVEELKERVKELPDMQGMELSSKVMTDEPYDWGQKYPSAPKFVVLDFGVKYNILNLLNERGVNVRVVPGRWSAEQILAEKPDAIFVSNGPGDPAAMDYAIKTIRELIGKKPLFGICLGHQLIGLALGGKSYKLKFGHRGGNHPVKDLRTGRVFITAQNHGFAIFPDSLPKDVEITHINLNDNTLEGFMHKDYKILAVQYHPENSPGPHDSYYIFDEFVSMI